MYQVMTDMDFELYVLNKIFGLTDFFSVSTTLVTAWPTEAPVFAFLGSVKRMDVAILRLVYSFSCFSYFCGT